MKYVPVAICISIREFVMAIAVKEFEFNNGDIFQAWIGSCVREVFPIEDGWEPLNWKRVSVCVVREEMLVIMGKFIGGRGYIK